MSKRIEHNSIRILYVLALGTLSLYLISPFLVPIMFAGTISLALFPLLKKLERQGFGRKKASALLTATFGTIISLPFFFFVVKGTLAVTEQLEKLYSDIRYKNQGVHSIYQTIKGDIISAVQRYGERFGVGSFLTDERMDTTFAKIYGFLLKFFQDFASSLPTVFLYFLVMIICTYSFLKNAETVRRGFQEILGFNNEKMDQLVRVFILDSRSVYFSNITTGAIQSLIIASGVAFLGLGDFFIVFFVTLILSFIPVIGAAPVGFLFAIYAFFLDKTTAAMIMLVVGTFTGLIDNFLRPYLASLGESRIPPVVAFVFVVGGALMLGFPGLFIGLLAGSYAVDTLPLFWEELGKRTARAENFQRKAQSIEKEMTSREH
jgi:predicted PurR-regulated permease PerM